MIKSDFSTQRPAEQKRDSHGGVADQFQHLFRAIGISAVAAAAAQVARPESKPAKPVFQVPACLRDEDDGLAA
jgi:hypothetical protein